MSASTLAVGTHQLTAVFTPTNPAAYDPATSPAVSLTVTDRAMGPMRFIPFTWRRYGVGNQNNIYDSTLAAGRYLCAGGTDLSDPAQQQAAVFRYNHSAPYGTSVLRWTVAYQTGVVSTPSAPGLVPPVTSGDGGLVFTAAGAPPATSPATTLAPQSLD